eukprot:gene32601-42221_t
MTSYKACNVYAQEYLCNSSSKSLTGKFLLQQWINAQNEIGLAQQISSSLTERKAITRDHFKAIELILININSCDNGVRLFYTVKGPILPYVTLWKCASDGITQNLRRLTYRKTKVANTNATAYKDNALLSYGVKTSKDAIIFNILSEYTLSLWKAGSSPPYFTFVREPFQRFIAGFVESIHRTLHPVRDGRHPEEKLAALLGYKNVSSMANVRLDFSDPETGQFRINEEIVGLMLNKETTFGERVAYDSKLGDHPTAQNFPPNRENATNGKTPGRRDPDDARKSVKNFLKKNRKYTKAICHILLIDYVCLPEYSLPEECQFLNQSKTMAVNALRRGVTLPARRPNSKKRISN